jgi:hypothetical protein
MLQGKAKRAPKRREAELAPLRQEAYNCWVVAHKDLAAATRLFVFGDPKSRRKNAARFVERAVRMATTHYSFKQPYAGGQLRKVPGPVAEQAVQTMWEGYVAEGEQRYWTSIRAAVGASPALGAICCEYRCSPDTLLRAMREVEPACRSRLERVVRLLTAENKRDRKAAASLLLKKDLPYLRRIFWLDAATIYILPEGRRVYAPPHVAFVVSDARLNGHSKALRKLKFYILVNAVGGPVDLQFVTGTTSLESEDVWLVSAHPPSALPALAWVRCVAYSGAALVVHTLLLAGYEAE